MTINDMRNSISVSTKKGISFTLAALVIWMVITVIYRTDLEVVTKNFVTFFAGGIMLPLSMMFSKITGAKWKTDNHPLGSLGLIMNFAQLMYFPILFLAFNQAPDRFILFYAIITCGHIFPYGWLYRSTVYYVVAPLSTVVLLILAGNSTVGSLWIIPLITVCSLLLLNIGLFYEVALLEKNKSEKLLKMIK